VVEDRRSFAPARRRVRTSPRGVGRRARDGGATARTGRASGPGSEAGVGPGRRGPGRRAPSDRAQFALPSHQPYGPGPTKARTATRQVCRCRWPVSGSGAARTAGAFWRA